MLAVATLALLVLFHLLRFLATRCNGNACEWFIPVSLILPLLILVLVGVTGFAALPAASRRQQRSAWPLAIGITTMLGVVGPIVSLLVFSDSPDQFVVIATVLVALPLTVTLTYSLVAKNA